MMHIPSSLLVLEPERGSRPFFYISLVWFVPEVNSQIRHIPVCTEVSIIFVANWSEKPVWLSIVSRFYFGVYHGSLVVKRYVRAICFFSTTGVLQWKQFRSNSAPQTLWTVRQKTVIQPDLYVQSHSISSYFQPLSQVKGSLEADVTLF